MKHFGYILTIYFVFTRDNMTTCNAASARFATRVIADVANPAGLSNQDERFAPFGLIDKGPKLS